VLGFCFSFAFVSDSLDRTLSSFNQSAVLAASLAYSLLRLVAFLTNPHIHTLSPYASIACESVQDSHRHSLLMCPVLSLCLVATANHRIPPPPIPSPIVFCALGGSGPDFDFDNTYHPVTSHTIHHLHTPHDESILPSLSIVVRKLFVTLYPTLSSSISRLSISLRQRRRRVVE